LETWTILALPDVIVLASSASGALFYSASSSSESGTDFSDYNDIKSSNEGGSFSSAESNESF
jgi:hypothetical protein